MSRPRVAPLTSRKHAAPVRSGVQCGALWQGAIVAHATAAVVWVVLCLALAL